jgi:Cu-Zn family superoxide dismutase
MLREALALAAMLVIGSSASVEGHAVPPGAQAELTDAQGSVLGKATFTQLPDGVLIRLKAANLPPGVHGFHIHERAECHAPGFTTAGGHFNPGGKAHGFKNPNGPHAGDLPNVTVGQDGTLDVSTLATGVTLKDGPNSLFKEGGTSLMIHAGPDDYMTDPAGNSGARIACGPITRMR